MNDFKINKLWNDIESNLFNDDINMNNFKSSNINYRIALWNPLTRGETYLKQLIYNLCNIITKNEWKLIKNTHNRNYGNPIEINYNNTHICLDYLQAAKEASFISNDINMNNKTILEIGAGYGRTAHLLLSNYNIKEYHIIDLEGSLKLSKLYLSKVLSDEIFDKITFHNINNINISNIDICINIDSFAEMDKSVVINYLKLINNICDHLYIKNTVGKYKINNISNSEALNTGLLTDIIDIYDQEIVKKQSNKFISAYKPNNDWTSINDSCAFPWSYYWQAIYRKD